MTGSLRPSTSTTRSFTSTDCAGIAELGDDKWAIKRPRGTNPAIARGDLEAIAAVAAAVASAGRPGSAPGRNPRTSRFRCGLLIGHTDAQIDAAQDPARPCAAMVLGPELHCNEDRGCYKGGVRGMLAVWKTRALL